MNQVYTLPCFSATGCCLPAPGFGQVPPADPYEALRRCLIQIYTLSNFHRYQALQSLPFLSNKRPSELMDKIFILLRDLFMDRLPAYVWIHLLSEFINDPPGMAQHANDLWMIWGLGASVQTLSDNQFEDVNAIPHSSYTWGFRSGSIISTNSTSNWDHGSSKCWYQRRWRDNGYIMLVVCSSAWWIWSWMTFPTTLSILMTFL